MNKKFSFDIDDQDDFEIAEKLYGYKFCLNIAIL